jgi:hypothetical protein
VTTSGFSGSEKINDAETRVVGCNHVLAEQCHAGLGTAADRGTFASRLTLGLLMVGPAAPGPPWSPS